MWTKALVVSYGAFAVGLLALLSYHPAWPELPPLPPEPERQRQDALCGGKIGRLVGVGRELQSGWWELRLEGFPGVLEYRDTAHFQADIATRFYPFCDLAVLPPSRQ